MICKDIKTKLGNDEIKNKIKEKKKFLEIKKEFNLFIDELKKDFNNFYKTFKDNISKVKGYIENAEKILSNLNKLFEELNLTLKNMENYKNELLDLIIPNEIYNAIYSDKIINKKNKIKSKYNEYIAFYNKIENKTDEIEKLNEEINEIKKETDIFFENVYNFEFVGFYSANNELTLKEMENYENELIDLIVNNEINGESYTFLKENTNMKNVESRYNTYTILYKKIKNKTDEIKKLNEKINKIKKLIDICFEFKILTGFKKFFQEYEEQISSSLSHLITYKKCCKEDFENLIEQCKKMINQKEEEYNSSIEKIKEKYSKNEGVYQQIEDLDKRIRNSIEKIKKTIENYIKCELDDNIIIKLKEFKGYFDNFEIEDEEFEEKNEDIYTLIKIYSLIKYYISNKKNTNCSQNDEIKEEEYNSFIVKIKEKYSKNEKIHSFLEKLDKKIKTLIKKLKKNNKNLKYKTQNNPIAIIKKSKENIKIFNINDMLNIKNTNCSQNDEIKEEKYNSFIVKIKEKYSKNEKIHSFLEKLDKKIKTLIKKLKKNNKNLKYKTQNNPIAIIKKFKENIKIFNMNDISNKKDKNSLKEELNEKMQNKDFKSIDKKMQNENLKINKNKFENHFRENIKNCKKTYENSSIECFNNTEKINLLDSRINNLETSLNSIDEYEKYKTNIIEKYENENYFNSIKELFNLYDKSIGAIKKTMIRYHNNTEKIYNDIYDKENISEVDKTKKEKHKEKIEKLNEKMKNEIEEKEKYKNIYPLIKIYYLIKNCIPYIKDEIEKNELNSFIEELKKRNKKIYSLIENDILSTKDRNSLEEELKKKTNEIKQKEKEFNSFVEELKKNEKIYSLIENDILNTKSKIDFKIDLIEIMKFKKLLNRLLLDYKKENSESKAKEIKDRFYVHYNNSKSFIINKSKNHKYFENYNKLYYEIFDIKNKLEICYLKKVSDIIKEYYSDKMKKGINIKLRKSKNITEKIIVMKKEMENNINAMKKNIKEMEDVVKEYPEIYSEIKYCKIKNLKDLEEINKDFKDYMENFKKNTIFSIELEDNKIKNYVINSITKYLNNLYKNIENAKKIILDNFNKDDDMCLLKEKLSYIEIFLKNTDKENEFLINIDKYKEYKKIIDEFKKCEKYEKDIKENYINENYLKIIEDLFDKYNNKLAEYFMINAIPHYFNATKIYNKIKEQLPNLEQEKFKKIFDKYNNIISKYVINSITKYLNSLDENIKNTKKIILDNFNKDDDMCLLKEKLSYIETFLKNTDKENEFLINIDKYKEYKKIIDEFKKCEKYEKDIKENYINENYLKIIEDLFDKYNNKLAKYFIINAIPHYFDATKIYYQINNQLPNLEQEKFRKIFNKFNNIISDYDDCEKKFPNAIKEKIKEIELNLIEEYLNDIKQNVTLKQEDFFNNFSNIKNKKENIFLLDEKLSYMITLSEIINKYEEYKKEKIKNFEQTPYFNTINEIFEEYDNIFNVPIIYINMDYDNSIKIYNEIKRNMNEKEKQKYKEKFKKIYDNLTNLNMQNDNISEDGEYIKPRKSDDSIDEEIKKEIYKEKYRLNKSLDTIKEDKSENSSFLNSEKDKSENKNNSFLNSEKNKSENSSFLDSEEDKSENSSFLDSEKDKSENSSSLNSEKDKNENEHKKDVFSLYNEYFHNN